MKKIFSFLIVAICISLATSAQTIEKKWGFGAGAGGYYNIDTKSLGFTPEAYLSRYLSKSFDLMVHANIGYFGNNSLDEPLDMMNPALNLRYKFYNGYILPIQSKFQPYLYAGPGFMLDNATNGVNFNAGAGVKYPLNKTLSLYAEAGYLSGIDAFRTEKNVKIPVKDDFMKFTVGIEISFLRQPDRDKDGVIDILDDCPNTPKGAIVDEKGCPSDADGDGVFDGIDQCPNTPMGAKVDEKGCPLDTDGDGVIDFYDKCPDTPKGIKVDEKGCPVDSDGDGVTDDKDKCPDTPKGIKVDAQGCPVDSDGDGVTDDKDKCPDTPAGMEVDKDGCPVDSDGDGVSDKNDKCPGTPKGTVVDKDGCPDIQATLDMINGQLKPIYYDTNLHNITSDQNVKVDNIVKILNENPDFKVNIYGYADPRGDAELNKALSQRRVQSVVAQLRAKGIAADRITTTAYGEEKAPEGELSDSELQENRKSVAFMFVSF